MGLSLACHVVVSPWAQLLAPSYPHQIVPGPPSSLVTDSSPGGEPKMAAYPGSWSTTSPLWPTSCSCYWGSRRDATSSAPRSSWHLLKTLTGGQWAVKEQGQEALAAAGCMTRNSPEHMGGHGCRGDTSKLSYMWRLR